MIENIKTEQEQNPFETNRAMQIHAHSRSIFSLNSSYRIVFCGPAININITNLVIHVYNFMLAYACHILVATNVSQLTMNFSIFAICQTRRKYKTKPRNTSPKKTKHNPTSSTNFASNRRNAVADKIDCTEQISGIAFRRSNKQRISVDWDD